MSLDYTIYLRDRPDLSTFVADFPDLEPEDEHWSFCGLRLSVSEYAASEEDPLDDQPWRDEIRWCVSGSGHHNDDSWDDWKDLESAIATKYRGASYLDISGDLQWYWWDAAALTEQVTELVMGDPDALLAFYETLKNVEGSDGEGPRHAIGRIVIAHLDAIAESKAKTDLMNALWRDHEAYDPDHARLLEPGCWRTRSRPRRRPSCHPHATPSSAIGERSRKRVSRCRQPMPS